MSVPVEDLAPAIIEVVQAGITPIAVSFLTSRIQVFALNTDVLAAFLVTAGGQSVAATVVIAIPVTMIASADGATKMTVIVDEPVLLAIVYIDRRVAPPAVSLLACGVQPVAIHANVLASFLIIAARQAILRQANGSWHDEKQHQSCERYDAIH